MLTESVTYFAEQITVYAAPAFPVKKIFFSFFKHVYMGRVKGEGQ